jgi:hypothetical protein
MSTELVGKLAHKLAGMLNDKVAQTSIAESRTGMLLVLATACMLMKVFCISSGQLTMGQCSTFYGISKANICCGPHLALHR